MKTTVEIRDPLMAEAKAVCALHNITMKGLIERALAAEIEKLAAQPRWQPTDEFIIHGDVMINTDVDAEIAAMYEDMIAHDFMSHEDDE
jgi:post-segregation antitoxin (ccd killing protein)